MYFIFASDKSSCHIPHTFHHWIVKYWAQYIIKKSTILLRFGTSKYKFFASAELESDRASNRLALRRGGGAFSSSSNPWECFDEKDALRSFVSTFAFSGTLHYSHHFAVDYDGVHDAH